MLAAVSNSQGHVLIVFQMDITILNYNQDLGSIIFNV